MEKFEIYKRAAEHWSEITSSESNKKIRWWQSPQVWSHINKISDVNESSVDVHGGFHRLLSRYAIDGSYSRGVSVGCGTGEKELRL